jgi:membrane fusion protein, heavy metal efflux system
MTSCRDRHGHKKAEGRPEIPSLVVTAYESGLELFLEYPALVVGKPSPLVAHFTDASDPGGFKVIAKGRATAFLRYADGSEQRFVAEKPLRDGIFKPVVTPGKAGEGTLILTLEGEQASGSVSAGTVTVHADEKAVIAATPKAEETAAPTVSFLKEAQWKTRYATTPAAVRVIEGAVRANGELKAVPGQSAELSTPIAALIPVTGRVPHLGQVVKKGELLLTLAPTNLASGSTQASVDLEVSRAAAEAELAARELRRAEELFAAKAIPEKQVDAARTAAKVAAARAHAAERERGVYRSAQVGAAGGRRGGFELRSPLDGVISFAEVMPGAAVEPGTRLLAVVNPTRLWLEAKIYEADIPRVEQSDSASFTVAGFEQEFVVDGKNGRRVAVGAVVDPATRTVPIVFELANPEGRLKPGMFAKVNVSTGETIRGLAVPESALVDDNGRPVVFVLLDAETFEKRVVSTGVRSGGFVQVLEGLKAKERVVSQGAYEIKLASATGAIPAHGHQH